MIVCVIVFLFHVCIVCKGWMQGRIIYTNVFAIYDCNKNIIMSIDYYNSKIVKWTVL